MTGERRCIALRCIAMRCASVDLAREGGSVAVCLCMAMGLQTDPPHPPPCSVDSHPIDSNPRSRPMHSSHRIMPTTCHAQAPRA